MNTLRADEMEERFPGLLAAVIAASAAEAASTARPAAPGDRRHPKTGGIPETGTGTGSA
ncbi:hypothetical protein NKH77_16855 [Streptomyces sp. M19]